MKDEKEQGTGGKTPPKKPRGNGRGAQPIQGTGRGTTRPVRRFDVDIPGPGEPETGMGLGAETPVPAGEKPEESVAAEKKPAERPKRTAEAKDTGETKAAGTVPPAGKAAQEQWAPPPEEPTVRFRKGQVPVKGPKPPARRGAVSSRRGSVPAGGSQTRRETPGPTTDGKTGQGTTKPATSQSGQGTPKTAADDRQQAGQSSPPAEGCQGRGRPVGVRGVRADGPRTAGQPPKAKEAPAGNGRGAQKSQRPVPPPSSRPPREQEEAEKPRYTGKQLILRRCYIALTVLSAIIVAVYAGFRLFAAPPEVKPPAISRPPVIITTTDPEGNQVEMIEPDISSSDRKQEFYTFLLVGESQEAGGGLTDTMILVSYDVPNQKLSLMSLPRDIYVSENERLLNSVYTRAGGGEEGMTALQEQVQKLTGIYPDFGISLKWEAVGELVEAIGGVWFDVPRDMHYWDPTQNLRINVDKGYQLLNGEDAMGVVRFRATYVDGDLGRIKVQQDFLKALISQCLQMDNLLKNLGSYLDIFQRNVNTNLTVGNLTYFATNALTGLDMDNVTFTTLPNASPYEGCDHLVGVPRQIVVTVNQYFNPYKTDIRLSELDVVTNISRPTPKPTPTPEPTETPKVEDPKESHRPTESEEPEDPVTQLPPGVSPTPKPSARPSQPPEESREPEPTAAPTPTPELPALTPPPAPSAPSEPEGEPLLPPGI